MSPIKSCSSSSQNLWHGSIETSTDTLVPIEKTTNSSINLQQQQQNDDDNIMTEINDRSDKNIINNSCSSNSKILRQENGASIINGNNYINDYDDDVDNLQLSCSGVIENGDCDDIVGFKSRTISSSSQMDESIVIQPEFERLDINGKFDRYRNSYTNLIPNKSINDLSPNKHFLNGR